MFRNYIPFDLVLYFPNRLKFKAILLIALSQIRSTVLVNFEVYF